MLVDSPWLGVEAQVCKLPNGKLISPFYVVKQPDWVLILARDTEGKWVLGRQYRHGQRRWFLEFPAGIIDADEGALAAAKRELLEESGFGGGEWECLQSYSVNPDRQSAMFHIVFAKNVTKQAETKFDESEDIHLHRLDAGEIDSRVGSGGIEHPHHILAWVLNRHKF
jgi:8-oxo-dGTP pyrophosphatase MutT (NUDIX family)